MHAPAAGCATASRGVSLPFEGGYSPRVTVRATGVPPTDNGR